MRLKLDIRTIRRRPITVPKPHDYRVKLEAAREQLRKTGRTACIDPPQRSTWSAALFQVMS